jgi:hypothetical protein
VTAPEEETGAAWVARHYDPNLIEGARPPDPRGGYVHRPSQQKRHECPLPAEWEDGAVWRCPEGHLWVVVVRVPPGLRRQARYWQPATWLQRRRYGGRHARLGMANGNRIDPDGYDAPRDPPRAPRTPGGFGGAP